MLHRARDFTVRSRTMYAALGPAARRTARAGHRSLSPGSISNVVRTPVVGGLGTWRRTLMVPPEMPATPERVARHRATTEPRLSLGRRPTRVRHRSQARIGPRAWLDQAPARHPLHAAWLRRADRLRRDRGLGAKARPHRDMVGGPERRRLGWDGPDAGFKAPYSVRCVHDRRSGRAESGRRGAFTLADLGLHDQRNAQAARSAIPEVRESPASSSGSFSGWLAAIRDGNTRESRARSRTSSTRSRGARPGTCSPRTGSISGRRPQRLLADVSRSALGSD